MARPMKYLMRMRHVALPGALVLLLAGSHLAGQEAAQTPARQAPQATFKSGVEVVTVSVSVRDDDGKVIKDLTKSDFEVFDSGFKKEIRDFFVGDSPVSLALLLDISGSMAVGGNMDRAREAIAVATMNLRSDTDEGALFTFDSELRQVVGFTTDTRRIHQVSLKGKPWGQTSLYDAVAHAARAVANRNNKHRALVVISDGVDTASRMTAAEVSGIASSIDVPVYLLARREPAGSSRGRARSDRDRRPHGSGGNSGGSRALDGRRYARGQRPRSHVGGDSGSVHRAASSIPHHLRAGCPSRLASARDSYTEEEPCRSRARRVHVRPHAQR